MIVTDGLGIACRESELQIIFITIEKFPYVWCKLTWKRSKDPTTSHQQGILKRSQIWQNLKHCNPHYWDIQIMFNIWHNLVENTSQNVDLRVSCLPSCKLLVWGFLLRRRSCRKTVIGFEDSCHGVVVSYQARITSPACHHRQPWHRKAPPREDMVSHLNWRRRPTSIWVQTKWICSWKGPRRFHSHADSLTHACNCSIL